MRASLAYALVAALANLVGAGAVAARPRWSPTALEAMTALAAGFLVSASLMSIFPEALARGGAAAAPVAVAGYLLVHLTQHTLVRHFHFGEETHEVNQAVGVSALSGLMLHTFVDGVAIASGFRVGAGLGVIIFLGILLHKIPEGLAISSLFLAAGAGRRRALLAAGALGAATVAGALLTDAVAPLAAHGLALSAGVTLYVAASNLVPEFQAKRGWWVPAGLLAGCALYGAARRLTGH
ncbi:MAG TPA: ZIP family metal transporter [Gemmatimonadaceae bacterium]|nr:ZIP family metal transporter [Gemmatimonadaceae bacterium]